MKIVSLDGSGSHEQDPLNPSVKAQVLLTVLFLLAVPHVAVHDDHSDTFLMQGTRGQSNEMDVPTS